jgi:hypothetical protein
VLPRMDLNSHVSYHADGTYHHKSLGHKFFVRKWLPMNGGFSGLNKPDHDINSGW